MLPNDLKLFYASAALSAHDESLTQFTVSADSVSRTEFSFTTVPGFDLPYAIGWFNLHTTTQSLRRVFFSVRDVVLLSGVYTVTLSVPLPDLPVAGDVFYLLNGLNFRSDQQISFNTANMFVPEMTTITALLISGVTIKRVRSAVDLYLYFDATGPTLSVSTDGLTWNTPVDLSGSDVSDVCLQAVTGDWIEVDVDVSALPSDSVEELINIDALWQTWLPSVWLDSENQDSVLHHFSVLENDGSDTKDVKIQCVSSIGTATVAETYTDGDLTITLSDVDGLPGRDFWLYLNESADDLRYVTKRAGNVCYLADTSDWIELPFDQGALVLSIDKNVTEDGGSGEGILRACYHTAGAWGGTAEGLLIVSSASDPSSSWADGNKIRYGPGQFVYIDGTVNKAIRGINRLSSWSAGSSVQWYPAFDILTLDPDSNEEFVEIDGCQEVISTPMLYVPWTVGSDRYTGEILSSFGPGDSVALAIRQYLLDDLQGSLGVVESLRFDWST